MGAVGALAQLIGVDFQSGDKYHSKAWERRRSRYYKDHAHICHACLWQILLYVLTLGHWSSKHIELHHRNYRHKFGHESDASLCPLCNDHHGESDALRRLLEGERGKHSWRSLYVPLNTIHRFYLLTQWFEQLFYGVLAIGVVVGIVLTVIWATK